MRRGPRRRFRYRYTVRYPRRPPAPLVKFEKYVSTVAQTVAPPPSLISELADCAAVLLPADPPRSSQIAFWRPDGTPPLRTDDADDTDGSGAHGDATAPLTVALPDEEGHARPCSVPALRLPVREALPVLTRARAGAGEDGSGPGNGSGNGSAAAFWGSAAVLALHLAARGRLLPGLSREDHDAWRMGPLEAADIERLRDLAASMPPYAHAVPLPGEGPLRLPRPEALVHAFLDAVADGLPRTPAAALAAGGPAFAADPPQRLPEQRAWAADVAAGHDAGVRLSLRVEVTGLEADGEDETREADAGAADTSAAAPARSGGPRFRGVLQLHSLTDPTLVADAAEVWAGNTGGTRGAGGAAEEFGPRARTDTLLTLRRAAGAWEPLAPLLSAAVPDAVELADEEIAELLGAPVSRALAAAGLQVHWPRHLAQRLTSRALVSPDGDQEAPSQDAPHGTRGPDGSALPSLLGAEALLSFSWRFAVGDQELTRDELDRLAETGRPLVRLRGEWVLVDPEAVRKARRRQDRRLTSLDALGSVLTGSVEEDGERIEVRATGRLETLRERLADPESVDRTPLAQPPKLDATLRDYQLRGLDWLHRMTSLGLGGCLADDMGLGKTITLIALHLHRQQSPASAGPTLVVCPTSLMGNWQREIERFAPGTPVRRYHGTGRSLEGLAEDEFVLTTYGTMRLDAARLARLPGTGPETGTGAGTSTGASTGTGSEAPAWGMVVADEAQHVKNPFSQTARQLRTVPARARVALTGTPVENNLSELWAILDWTTPGLLGRLGTFRRRYADAVEGGDPAAGERLARLVRPFLLRRRKTDPGIAP
ncbi:ATP-dependent helicase, partial [Streptomyces daliensis]|nr:ATP-dependent helicase [Streptomyces daliensis]